MAHCPVSNMKLASGVALIPRMLELDVPVGLAVDGSASNDGSNLLEEMRVAYLLHRLNWSRKAPSGYEILKLATRGSARDSRERRIGPDQPRAWRRTSSWWILNRIEMVGAQFDPASALCTVGLKGSVNYTVVNGRDCGQGRKTGQRGRGPDCGESQRGC